VSASNPAATAARTATLEIEDAMDHVAQVKDSGHEQSEHDRQPLARHRRHPARDCAIR
jgi:hypothetical protein